MTNQEAMEKAFTSEQIDWIFDHKLKGSGTQEQKIADLAEQLFSAGVYEDEKDGANLLNLSAKPKRVYSVKDILTTVSPTTKVDSNAISKFIDDWNEGYRGEHGKGRLYMTYGPGSMENADKVMKQAYADKQAAVKPMGTAESVLGTLLLPRSTEARKAGKKASGKDIGLDLLENALMLAPLGMVTAIPKIARAGRVAKALTGIGTAAIVPHVMEGVDAREYSPSENLDRSVYNETDALLGWATNVGAPLVFNRTVGRLGKFAADKVAGAEGKGLSDVTKEVLKGLRKDDEWIKPDKNTVEAVRKFNHSEQAKSNLSKSAGADVSKKASESKDIAQQALENFRKSEEAQKEIEKMYASGKYDANKLARLQNQMFSQGKAGQLNATLAKEKTNDLTTLQKELSFVEDKFAKTNGAQDYIEAGLLAKRSQETGKAIPELLKSGEAKDILDFSKQLADADWMAKLQMSHPGAAKALDIGRNMAGSWVVNKYGSKRDATPVLGGVSNLIQSVAPGTDLQKVFQNMRKENVEPVERQYRKDIAKSVLDNLPKDASDDDKKFMKMVVDNPDVLKGMGKGNTPAFRNWYLLRGSDILRGTELYRPTFEVE
jgi:hypothetical protein